MKYLCNFVLKIEAREFQSFKNFNPSRFSLYFLNGIEGAGRRTELIAIAAAH